MSIITLVQTFDDLYIDSSQPDTNFNSSPVLWIGKQEDGAIQRLLAKFDLSFIPVGSSIIYSNLDLYLDYDASETEQEATITPYVILESWDASTVSWNNQPAISDSLTGTAVDVSGPGYYSWTVTDIVNQWVNGGLSSNGFELKTKEIVSGENKRFVSSDETQSDKQSFKPVLVIQYDPVPLAGISVNADINAVVARDDTDKEYKEAVTIDDTNKTHEEVVTSDEFQSTIIRNRSDKSFVSFFVTNKSTNLADVGIEVSADGVNFLRQSYDPIPQGLEIFIPYYFSTYIRLYYKSNSEGKPTTLSIDYVAQD